ISGCPFFLWGLLAFMGLALVISLIFNISHYVEKKRQDKIYRYSDDYNSREKMPFPFLIVNTNFKMPSNMPIPGVMILHMLVVLVGSAKRRAEDQMCYATLDHSFKGKRRRPRKQNANLADREKDAQVCAMDANISQINLVESSPQDNQAVEESVHDDPARLFGLIRAKREPVI
ncbi:hypothetical protein STEG23_002084, partial [Scotinomys teguina]